MTSLSIPSRSPAVFEPEETVSVSELVASAADVVAPVWPLKTFIAVNPLQGLEQLSFEQAVLEAERQKALNSEDCAGRESVNRELIKYCAAYFDEGQATIEMPGRQKGFFHAFRALAPYDGRLKAGKRLLATLPKSPEQAITECLDVLGIPAESREEFIRQSLSALAGWSGYVKWKENWQKKEEFARRPATLVELVAVRLVLTRILWPDAEVSEVAPTSIPSWLAQLPVNEAKYRISVLPAIMSQAKTMDSESEERPDAQLVFCIDVRSEPFRKAIESQGDYETFGFAGFFGLPVEVKACGDEKPHDSCPVLLKPRHLVCDEPTDSSRHACRLDAGRRLLRKPGSSYQWLKYHFATPFALVEMLGPWLGLRMFARTLAPSLVSTVAKKTAGSVMPKLATQPCLKEIPPSQRVDYAEGALRMTGLAGRLAPIVVLCAHGSSTTNNAYGSALDCGACGGNHGGANARILAAILNCKEVRTGLAARNLAIADDVLFVAAEHDTTTDHVELFGVEELASDQQARLMKLQSDLVKARALNAITRSGRFETGLLQSHDAVAETHRRSADWSEVRPEWGLARNAAFVVGPRRLTEGLDLEGRCFLHSYDWRTDPSGAFLTTILTAPMVVGQWINSQYLFSALDNVSYGSGSKVTHNVTGKLGVMQGNASDLMHGLPLQSVFTADDVPYHEPLRLTTFVYAPRSRVDAIVHEQEVLRTLFGNGWVTLACIDPENQVAYQLQRDFSWKIAC